LTKEAEARSEFFGVRINRVEEAQSLKKMSAIVRREGIQGRSASKGGDDESFVKADDDALPMARSWRRKGRRSA